MLHQKLGGRDQISRAAKSSQACQLRDFRLQPGELERIHLCRCKSLSAEGFLKADLGKLWHSLASLHCLQVGFSSFVPQKAS